uniref:Tetratricopeptide repeat domain 23 n=1 Tax=Mastacembelus armatus TaxID=205130 RepID=A0A3Q3LUR9_9TELE
MTSTNRRLDASPCGSEMSSLSQTQYAKKKLIMIPPEEKLKLFDSRAQAHENNQEFDACIQDLVRCVALTRLVYGEGHLKLAQAHARLAKAYFQFKGNLKIYTKINMHRLCVFAHTGVESAGHYFEQSLSAYKNCVGVQDPAFLAAQDDFCRFLLLNDQQERCIEIQRASLTSKRSTFGDLSAEVADTLQLIGSVEMTEGRMKQAHSTMTKCLEIQNLLYGPQHKKTKATQKAVDMLARAPDVAVAKRQQKPGRRKTTS